MKKMVLQLDYYDDKIKQKAIQKVCGLSDSKEKKLTVVGNVDPVNLVYKLRKLCRTDIVSVGPVKEPGKKKKEPKKDNPSKRSEEKKTGGGENESKPGSRRSGDFKKGIESKGDAVKAYPALPPPPAYHQQLQPFQYNRPQFPVSTVPASAARLPSISLSTLLATASTSILPERCRRGSKFLCHMLASKS